MTSTPMRLSIPESELPHLRTLARTDTALLRKMADSLPGVSAALERERLTRSLAEKAGVEVASAGPVVAALWRLAFVQRRLDVDASNFVGVLTNSMKTLPEDQWDQADTESWSERGEFIAELLRPDGAIVTCAKAADLIVEGQLIFCRARTLTDMRPVFDEAAQQVQGYVLFHTLRITCHEGSETRDIYLSMDGGDVRELRRQLDRAEKKERLLVSALQRSGLQVITAESEDD